MVYAELNICAKRVVTSSGHYVPYYGYHRYEWYHYVFVARQVIHLVYQIL